MGQYYAPIILGKNKKSVKAWFYSHAYLNGLKLMEHSYVGNNFVNAVVNYLIDNNGGRLVWAGDYADSEFVTRPKSETLPIWQEQVAAGLTTLSHEAFRKTSPLCLKDTECNLYGKCDGKGVLDYDTSDRDVFAFINEDKKQIIILDNCTYRLNGLAVHPLPLLTCEGNGRGGGDYHGSNQRFVGLWARDFIRPILWKDRRSIGLEDYKEITPCFFEFGSLGNYVEEFSHVINSAIEDLSGEREDEQPKGRGWEELKELNEALKKIPSIPKKYMVPPEEKPLEEE